MSEAKASVLHRKLSEALGEIGFVEKAGNNTFHRYRYATAEDVFAKVRASLSKRGVSMTVKPELLRFEPMTVKEKMKILSVVKVDVTFTDSETGEWAISGGIGSGEDSGDKAVMKANTAALKYALSHAFAISFGDDPEATDAEGKSTDTNTSRKPKKRAAAKDERTLAEAIDGAKGVDDLKVAGRRIVQELEKGSEEYAVMVAAYKAKESALSGA